MEYKNETIACAVIILVTMILIIGGVLIAANDKKEDTQNALAIRVSVLESQTSVVDDSQIQTSGNVELYYPTADCVSVSSKDSDKVIFDCVKTKRVFI